MFNPHISVIICCYNQGKFLEETVKSVLNQHYQNIEYIIIDGGSKDNSVEIIMKYEKYIAYWVSEKDNGQTHAVNKGFKKATGEILGWLNSDDTYLPGTLNRVALFMQKNLDIDAIYGNHVLTNINNQGLLIKKELTYSYHRLLFHNFQSQPATFFRRRVLDKIGFLNSEYFYSMDHEFFIRMGRYCKVCHVPYIFATYRIHPETKTTYNQ